jgi:hypothetical protein
MKKIEEQIEELGIIFDEEMADFIAQEEPDEVLDYE